MDIERFLEMFKEESDLKPKKLLRAYLNHHIKNSTQDLIKQPKVLEIRIMFWEVAIEIGDYNLLKHIIHCHHLSINFFSLLFELGDEELISFFTVKYPGEKIDLIYKAIQCKQNKTLAWVALWKNINFNSNNLSYHKLLYRTIEKISKSNQTIHLFDILIKKFGQDKVKKAINEISLISNFVLYSDVESFVWLWTKTKQKPLFGMINDNSFTLLNIALCNKKNSNIFEFLLSEAFNIAALAEIWFSPKNLSKGINYLFNLESMPFSEKFNRFSVLYNSIETTGLPCCKNCDKAHGKHFCLSELFKIKIETKQQLLQLLAWTKKQKYFLTKHDISKIKLLIYKNPELIFDIIPLTSLADRNVVISWLLVKPFDGCTSSSTVFKKLFYKYSPKKIWWVGILEPLKLKEKCSKCNQDKITCLELRINKWLGLNGDINKIIQAAKKLKLSQQVMDRLELIYRPKYSSIQYKKKQDLIKQISEI